MNLRNKAVVVPVGLLLLAATLAIRVERQAIPAWKVLVVDTDGNAIPHVAVNEEWMEFDREVTHGDQQFTDEAGRVVFPARVSSEMLIVRLFEKARPIAHAFACPDGKTGDVEWEPGMTGRGGRLVLHLGDCPFG